MNYIFFDFECSDGHHICSFGYIIVNENFEILKKDDIIINPKAKFKLGRKGEAPNINLAYSESEFKRAHEFPYYFDTIAKLLCSKGNMPCGHAVLSDLNFIKFACERYNISVPKIRAFDTQVLYKIYTKEPTVKSLKKILDALSIDLNNLSEHKSCDDAELSMLVLKKLCEIESKSISDMLNSYKDAIVKMPRQVKKEK